MKVYLIVDTNVFMHFRPIGEMGLEERFEKGAEIHVVVSDTIFRELDKHKDQHKNRKVKERCRKTMASLTSCFKQGEKFSGKFDVVYRRRSVLAEIEQLELDPDIPDHKILALGVQLIEEGECDRVAVLTNDGGFELLAHDTGVEVVLVDEAHRLKERDPVQEENEKLQSEISSLKSSRPRLTLGILANGGIVDHHKFTLERHPGDMNAFVSDAVAMAHANHPEIDLKTTSSSAMAHECISYPDALRYNDLLLPQYFHEVEEYSRGLYEVKVARSRVVFVRIALHNEGTALAENADVELRFPPGITVVGGDDPLRLPRFRPSPPNKPKPGGGFITQPRCSEPPSPTSALRINRLGKQTHQGVLLEARFDRVKHRGIEPLAVSALIFEDREAGPFSIKYSILPDNLPSPEVGKISVIV